MKEKRLLVTTLEAVLPVNGLLHDLDGLGDGKPSILLPIDTAVDKRARFRYGLDELAERAPAKQALGELGAIGAAAGTGSPDPTTSISEWNPVLRSLR